MELCELLPSQLPLFQAFPRIRNCWKKIEDERNQIPGVKPNTILSPKLLKTVERTYKSFTWFFSFRPWRLALIFIFGIKFIPWWTFLVGGPRWGRRRWAWTRTLLLTSSVKLKRLVVKTTAILRKEKKNRLLEHFHLLWFFVALGEPFLGALGIFHFSSLLRITVPFMGGIFFTSFYIQSEIHWITLCFVAALLSRSEENTTVVNRLWISIKMLSVKCTSRWTRSF